MSKLIIQIFINTEFFDHVSMVNGNSKLKYCLLVQEEKKKKQEMKQTQLGSTMRNYLMFLVRVVLVMVFCLFNHSNTFLEMEFCLEILFMHIFLESNIFIALQYLPRSYIAYYIANWDILWIKITSHISPSFLVKLCFLPAPQKNSSLILRILLDMLAIKPEIHSNKLV